MIEIWNANIHLFSKKNDTGKGFALIQPKFQKDQVQALLCSGLKHTQGAGYALPAPDPELLW